MAAEYKCRLRHKTWKGERRVYMCVCVCVCVCVRVGDGRGLIIYELSLHLEKSRTAIMYVLQNCITESIFTICSKYTVQTKVYKITPAILSRRLELLLRQLQALGVSADARYRSCTVTVKKLNH